MQHRKQLYSLFEGICQINNTTWNNPKGSYDDTTESAYQIEEALEGFDLVDDAKEISRSIVREYSTLDFRENACIPDVDRFDKALDAIYFAVGSMHKLGLSPDQMVDGLAAVHLANTMKGSAKDSNNKVIKPEGWEQYKPEPTLQKILDNRVY